MLWWRCDILFAQPGWGSAGKWSRLYFRSTFPYHDRSCIPLPWAFHGSCQPADLSFIVRRSACKVQENLLQGIDSIARAFLVAHHPHHLSKVSPIVSHRNPSLRISFQTCSTGASRFILCTNDFSTNNDDSGHLSNKINETLNNFAISVLRRTSQQRHCTHGRCLTICLSQGRQVPLYSCRSFVLCSTSCLYSTNCASLRLRHALYWSLRS